MSVRGKSGKKNKEVFKEDRHSAVLGTEDRVAGEESEARLSQRRSRPGDVFCHTETARPERHSWIEIQRWSLY